MKALFKPVFVTLISSFLTLSVFSQADPTKKVETKEYSLLVPASWETRIIGDVGISFIALSPLLGEQDPFRENMTVVVQDLTGTTNTLKSVMAESKRDIINELDRGNVFDEGTGKSAQGEYQRMAYTTLQNNVVLRYESRFYQKGSKIYILLFSAEKSLYADYEKRVNKMMDSFLITTK